MTTDSYINRFLQWSTVATLYGVCFFIRISPNTMQHELQSTLQLSYTDVGFLSSCFYYTYGSCQVLGAMASKKIGLHRCFAILILFLLAGLLQFCYSTTFYQAILGRVLMGMGSSLTFVYALSVARRVFPQKRFPMYVGLTNFMGMLGALSAQTPLEMWLQQWSWQQIFFGVFCVVLSLTPGLFFSSQPWLSSQENAPVDQSLRKDARQLWRSRGALAFWSLVALCMIAPLLAIPEMWGELYLKTLYNYSSIDASLILSAFFLGVASGSLTLGPLSLKVPMRHLLPLLILGEIGFLGSFLSPHIVCVSFMSFSAWGIGFCASGMLLFFSLLETAFAGNALAIPIFNMAIMIGSSAFQPMIGSFLDHLSPAMGLPLALMVALSLLPVLLGVVLILWIVRS